MHRVLGAVALGLFAGCFDTSLPPPPGAGSISGRVLVAAPGEPLGSPVSGAIITLVESGLSVESNDDGRFTLAPVVQNEGTLEISSGALKRVFSLRSIGAGFGRAASLGDVALSRNASVQGEVQLENSGEFGGTLVFIEGQPNSAYTSPSGAFVLRELPVGQVTLSVFRAGYAPQKLALELRSGERTAIEPLVLEVDSLTSSKVSGRAILEGLEDATGITVSTIGVETAVTSNGSFEFASLSPGVRTFTFRAEGRRTVTLANRLIAAASVELPLVTLTNGATIPPVIEPFPEYDAGAGGGTGTTGGGSGMTGGGSATGGGTGTPDAGTPGAVTRVSAGLSHTCAILEDKRAFCWGRDTFGQISGPPGADAVGVTLVATDVVDISAGSTHTCAIHTDAGIECWGSNSERQLGVVTPAANQRGYLPFGARSISAGNSFSCAVSGEVVQCWGTNARSQLGDGSSSNSRGPTQMDNVSVADAVDVGDDHACVLMFANGSPGVKCSGTTFGAGTQPPATLAINDVRHLGSSGVHACVARFDGSVWCWGASPMSGQAGGNTTLTPTAVGGVTNAVAVAAGGQHSCALRDNGGVTCWGLNASGQLGNGSLDGGAAGVTADIAHVVSVSAGGSHTCAIRDGGSLWCWGNNA
ncbi:MAG: hypothetical protein ACO1OB_31855, partial [Archangium sp.]